MEWVETTGRSIDEAKNLAMDQLGVAEDDAEFEILEEPRAGLFGRVRGEARVRARVRPTQPRPKADRRDRKKKSDADGVDPAERPAAAAAAPRASSRGARTPRSTAEPVDGTDSAAAATAPKARRSRSAAGNARGADVDILQDAVSIVVGDDQGDRDPVGAGGEGTDAGDSATRSPGGARRRGRGTSSPRREAVEEKQETDVDAAQVGEEARKFVQGLVEAFGLVGTATVRQDGDDLEVAVDGGDLGLLVGPRGVTLQAVQELTRVASQRRLGDHDTRLRVDVAGYRERRREALTRFALQVAEEVVASGASRSLEPMSSADRKVIHDALSEHGGVSTSSEGDDPARRVVIAPANA